MVAGRGTGKGVAASGGVAERDATDAWLHGGDRGSECGACADQHPTLGDYALGELGL